MACALPKKAGRSGPPIRPQGHVFGDTMRASRRRCRATGRMPCAPTALGGTSFLLASPPARPTIIPATWKSIPAAAGDRGAKEDEGAAGELGSVQGLAEEEDGQGEADERLQIAESRPAGGFDAGEAVAAEDEGQGRAACSQVEDEKGIAQGDRADPDGRQLVESAGQEKEQTVPGAAGDDREGVVSHENAAAEDGVGGEADGAGQGQEIAEGRGGGHAGSLEDERRDPGEGDQQSGEAAPAQAFAQEERRQQPG